MNTRKTMRLSALALVLAVSVTGCANMSPREQGTAKGAAAGALGGAVFARFAKPRSPTPH